MEYIKKEFAAYNVHIIKTKTFKTVTVEVDFLRKVKKEEITMRNFLGDILLQSTEDYPTKRLLSKEACKLYNLSINTGSSRIGNFLNLNFTLQYLNEKYTETGMQNKSLQFFFDTLFKPNIKDEKFDLKSFNIVKEGIKSDIKSIKDNMTKYGIIKLLSKMGEKEPYSYHGYGYMEDLEEITPDNLYEYYKEVLRSDKVDIFIVGDVDEEEILNFIKDNFKINTVKKDIGNIVIEHEKIRGRMAKITEEENISQSKLNIGCKLKGLNDFERKYVMLLYNEILGGSTESKLFKNVREKNSLAYYITSGLKIYDNILMIYSGINKSEFEKALNIIKREMTKMKKGNITDSEFENAKKTILASYDTIEDSPKRIIGLYYSKELGNGEDIEGKIENVNKVTKEEVIKIASKVKIDTVYLMYGKEN